MKFEQNNKLERIGKKVGYVISYVIFTIFLYLILLVFKKLPETWSIIHIALITLLITRIGVAIRRLLR